MNVVIQLYMYDLHSCTNEYERARKTMRQQEISACLALNLRNPLVKSVHALIDSEQALVYYQLLAKQVSDKPFVTNLFGRQPTYRDLMLYIKGAFPDGEIISLMNCDMFFNSNFSLDFLNQHLTTTRMFALTRHELTDENHVTCHDQETCPFTKCGGSADTFLFRTPIPAQFPYDSVNHKQNMFNGEGVFCMAWHRSGIEVLNPCKQLITVHLHKDRIYFEQYQTVGIPEDSFVNLTVIL